MAYLHASDKKILEDINKRKEFLMFMKNTKYDESDHLIFNVLNDSIGKKYLQFHSYQLALGAYLNPNTPIERMLIKWEAGVGKTLASISIALEYIPYLRREENDSNETDNKNTGSVFVIGFTKSTFYNQLIQFPELGFITQSEINELDKLKNLIAMGHTREKDKVRDIQSRIKKRLNNRRGNGFFQFIGNKVLVNRLFISDGKLNINKLSDIELREHLKAGKLDIDKNFLNSFNNSLILCDEIHNVYNSASKNNWGVALQYVLDNAKNTRVVFITATPINSNPAEIVDLLNLLIPRTDPIREGKEEYHRSDFFVNDRFIPRALNKIKDLCRGRVSFLRDTNPKFFPSRSIEGEEIADAPYLRFTRCPMSDLQYNTYKNSIKSIEKHHDDNDDNDDNDEKQHSASHDSMYLMDFALPNPDNKNIGIYQSSTVRHIYNSAPTEWKTLNGIDFIDGKITGNILKKENIGKISSKYERLINDLHEVIKKKGGKVLIFHPIVRMSGVLFIEELLKRNNIIGENDSSNANTMCICGRLRSEHKDNEMEHNSAVDVMTSNIAHSATGGGEQYKTMTAVSEHIKNVEFITGGYYTYDDEFVFQYRFAPIDDDKRDIVPVNDNMKKLAYVSIEDNGAMLYADTERQLSILGLCFGNLIEKMETVAVEIKVDDINLYDLFTSMGFALDVRNKNDDETILMVHRRGLDVIYDVDNNTNRVVVKGGASTRKNVKKPLNAVHKDKHFFTPVRYVIIHAEIDAVTRQRSMDKYNNKNNADGSMYMILIGSKMIKESYNFTNVRHEWIVARPANISVLKQIFGRGNRSKSHLDLPPEKRNITYRIYTTCLPEKYKNGPNSGKYIMSREEEIYLEKLEEYKIIQEEEKILHEVAWDSIINYDIIHEHKNDKAVKNDPMRYFEMLPFEPEETKKIRYDDIKYGTFSAFHSEKEVNAIIMIIKKLFLEISPVWKHNDLWDTVKQPPFIVEYNTKLFHEDMFNIAIYKLLWFDDEYVEIQPMDYHDSQYGTGGHNHMAIVRWLDSHDKFISMNGINYTICNVDDYYIMSPIDSDTGLPITDVESFMRYDNTKLTNMVNINTYLGDMSDISDYNDKLVRFYTKWNQTSIENMETATCDFGTDFHIKLLETCLEYVFNVWTNPSQKRDKYHEFYFKMLYYYNIRGLVMWAHTTKKIISEKYSKYVTPISVNLNNKNKMFDGLKIPTNIDADQRETANLLKLSINASDTKWAPTDARHQYYANLERSNKLLDSFNARNTKKKVPADMLPIGHVLNNIPRFFLPDSGGWFDSPEYVSDVDDYIENDKLIGYEERSKSGMSVIFKVRPPVVKGVRKRDTRKIEKGSVCSASKSKEWLKNIADVLEIKLSDRKYGVNDLCMKIRYKLIYNEFKERIINKSNIKWFYFSYEKQPT